MINHYCLSHWESTVSLQLWEDFRKVLVVFMFCIILMFAIIRQTYKLWDKKFTRDPTYMWFWDEGCNLWRSLLQSVGGGLLVHFQIKVIKWECGLNICQPIVTSQRYMWDHSLNSLLHLFRGFAVLLDEVVKNLFNITNSSADSFSLSCFSPSCRKKDFSAEAVTLLTLN